MSILDKFGFPHERPEAQELHRTLAKLYASPKSAQDICAKTPDFDTGMVNWDQSAYLLWFDILEYCGQNGLTRKLVDAILGKLSAGHPSRPFLQELVDNKPVTVNAEPPRGPDGAPAFDDTVFDNEALLYHEDLMLSTGDVPALIVALGHVVRLAPAVCRLLVETAAGSRKGTGFRIGPDLLLTNWHVLVGATDVTAEFHYERDGTNQPLKTVAVPCDAKSIVTDEADDWGVIRVAAALDDLIPIIPVEDIEPKVKQATFIIQHPNGHYKSLGYVRNTIAMVNDRVVHYLTDTQEGSSGAPVFDGAGRLVALHHAGGRPQTVVGKPPVSKNEGIRIGRVRAALQRAKIF